MREIGCTDAENLYKKLELAKRQLKNAKNKDEVGAIITYIQQLYAAIGFVCLKDLCRLDGKRVSSKKHIKMNNKKYISLKEKCIDNYIEQQDFHRDFYKKIFTPVNREMQHLADNDYSDITNLSEDDFYSIFFDFMSSIGLSSLFDKFVKNRRIYSGADDDIQTLGFTISNPYTKEADVFLYDMEYDLYSLHTLAHEFGHVYDSNRLSGTAKEFNNYRVTSFYQETISKTFERLFRDFLLKKNILRDETIDLSFDAANQDYLYILSAYLISLLPSNHIEYENYLDLSKTKLYKLTKDAFPKKSNVRKTINRMGELEELQECYSYAYGNIFSLIFSEMIKDNDGKLDVLDEFLPYRAQLFDPMVLDKFDITPKRYVKLYKKDIEILKKDSN